MMVIEADLDAAKESGFQELGSLIRGSDEIWDITRDHVEGFLVGQGLSSEKIEEEEILDGVMLDLRDTLSNALNNSLRRFQELNHLR